MKKYGKKCKKNVNRVRAKKERKMSLSSLPAYPVILIMLHHSYIFTYFPLNIYNYTFYEISSLHPQDRREVIIDCVMRPKTRKEMIHQTTRCDSPRHLMMITLKSFKFCGFGHNIPSPLTHMPLSLSSQSAARKGRKKVGDQD